MPKATDRLPRPSHPVLQGSSVEREVNDLLQAAWKARLLHVAVELDLPDLVAAGPVPASELVAATGAHSPSLRKLLRLLAVTGILECGTAPDGEMTFAGTPYTDVLREDVTGVVASDARFQAAPWHWAAWGQLEHSIRTGEEAFFKANGCRLWELIGADPASQSRFDHAMSSVSVRESREVPDCYDFVGYKHVVDVGGGTGSLLAAVLEKSPGTRGTLLDLSENAELARQRFAARGLLDRTEVIGGDFHDTVPSGADLYVIKHVLHNWDDDDVVDILKVVGRAMRPDSKILIVDNVVDSEASADALFVDLLMLVLVGGGDRSEQEFTELVRRAGMHVQSAGPAGPGALRFLECVVA